MEPGTGPEQVVSYPAHATSGSNHSLTRTVTATCLSPLAQTSLSHECLGLTRQPAPQNSRLRQPMCVPDHHSRQVPHVRWKVSLSCTRQAPGELSRRLSVLFRGAEAVPAHLGRTTAPPPCPLAHRCW